MPAIALLIDADQVGPQGIPALLRRLEDEWTVEERVCVRNWRSTKDQQEWRAASEELGLRLIQRDPVATGKNAADIELAIIAMDLLHAGHRAFCLVTGDMDFRPLVERLRRGGCHVDWQGPEALSLGRPSRGRAPAKKATRAARTPPASKKAARKATKKAGGRSREVATPKARAPARDQAPDMATFAKAVRRVVTELQREGLHERGWVSVNRVGNRLNRRGPWKEDFGFPKRRALHASPEEAGFRTEQLETGAYQVRLD